MSTTQCRVCNREFERTGPNSKFCAECAPIAKAKPTTRRERAGHGSKSDISRSEALMILAESIPSEHIQKTIVELAITAGRKIRLPLTEYLYRHGLKAAQGN